MGSGAMPGSVLANRRLSLLAFACAIGVAPLLFVGGPDWASGPLYRSVWNLGHIGLFALLTYALTPWQWLSGWRLWLAATGLVLLLGILIELLQSGLGREMDWRDLLRNLEGVWLVLAWQPILSRKTSLNRFSWALAAIIGVFVLFELAATSVVAARQWQVNHQLPLIYDFRHENPTSFWSGNLAPSTQHNTSHPYSLKIELGTETYSGISLSNLPADWRGYQQLTITLFNPAPVALPLTLRINDAIHDRGDNAFDDRYNTRLVLSPGLNTFTRSLDNIRNAPANRAMDMSRVSKLEIFAGRLPEPRTIYLSDLRLN